jgi:hypothetical protein
MGHARPRRPYGKCKYFERDGVQFKTCSKCEEPYPLDRKYFGWSSRDGLMSECRKCRNSRSRMARRG